MPSGLLKSLAIIFLLVSIAAVISVGVYFFIKPPVHEAGPSGKPADVAARPAADGDGVAGEDPVDDLPIEPADTATPDVQGSASGSSGRVGGGARKSVPNTAGEGGAAAAGGSDADGAGEDAEDEAEEPASACSGITGVTQNSATSYTLTDTFVDKYIRDTGTAQTQGSAGWKTNKAGEKIGFRVRKLRCAPRMAGIQNKDVIQSINGRELTNIGAAWAAYRDVTKGGSFTVKLRRGGQPMTLRYDVR